MNPLKLGFYPPCWREFLQAAKLEMRLQAVLSHPVPEHHNATQLARDVLDTVLWQYHSKKIKLEISKSFHPPLVDTIFMPLVKITSQSIAHRCHAW